MRDYRAAKKTDTQTAVPTGTNVYGPAASPIYTPAEAPVGVATDRKLAEELVGTRAPTHCQAQIPVPDGSTLRTNTITCGAPSHTTRTVGGREMVLCKKCTDLRDELDSAEPTKTVQALPVKKLEGKGKPDTVGTVGFKFIPPGGDPDARPATKADTLPDTDDLGEDADAARAAALISEDLEYADAGKLIEAARAEIKEELAKLCVKYDVPGLRHGAGAAYYSVGTRWTLSAQRLVENGVPADQVREGYVESAPFTTVKVARLKESKASR